MLVRAMMSRGRTDSAGISHDRLISSPGWTAPVAQSLVS
jgi:hypothetical protein